MKCKYISIYFLIQILINTKRNTDHVCRKHKVFDALYFTMFFYQLYHKIELYTGSFIAGCFCSVYCSDRDS